MGSLAEIITNKKTVKLVTKKQQSVASQNELLSEKIKQTEKRLKKGKPNDSFFIKFERTII